MQLSSSISAVITGGASGLGEATARLLASHGVKVGLFDLFPPEEWIAGSNEGRRLVGILARQYLAFK